MMQPLYDCLKGETFELTPGAVSAFHTLKLTLTTTPALGIPNYKQTFTLYCHEQGGFASGVLF